MSAPPPLRILHVLRAPVGGLFRHVIDLARAQTARGHAVGLIADSNSGGEAAARALSDLQPALQLGIARVSMSRHVGASDLAAIRSVAARARKSADILHGHGAKGGAYARLAPGTALRVYTPHGGSLHYSPASPLGLAYLAAERAMKRRTDLVLFESEFARATYRHKIGEPGLARVVHNGVAPDELVPVEPEADAVDFIYLGELRRLKGVFVLMDALSLLAAEGWTGSAIFYGDGPDRTALEARAEALGLVHQLHFPGPAPARLAFRSGRVLVVPSLAESLPYVVLEAAAAAVPMVATRVGGIPEIFGPDADALVPPGDAATLAAAIGRLRTEGAPDVTQRLRDRVARSFTVEAMVNGVLAAYDDARRKAARGRPIG
jgi:glycosyltransferase involved in cell wall biosynthesis